WCTSMGRMLMSGMAEPELRDLLGRSDVRKLTAKTVTDVDALVDIVRGARADGFALVDEELEIGLRSIAVPIRDRSGRIVAAVNVSTQSGRHTPAALRRDILPPLSAAAREIEGYFALQ